MRYGELWEVTLCVWGAGSEVSKRRGCGGCGGEEVRGVVREVVGGGVGGGEGGERGGGRR